MNSETAGSFLSIKLYPGQLEDQISALEETFKTTYPDELYNYHLADDFIGRMYESEQRMSRLVFALTMIIIFIAVMD